MITEATFIKFASDLANTYGVYYDEKEEFVECPECEEPILRCDWEDKDIEHDYVYSEKVGRGKLIPHIMNGWKCPICESTFED